MYKNPFRIIMNLGIVSKSKKKQATVTQHHDKTLFIEVCSETQRMSRGHYYNEQKCLSSSMACSFANWWDIDVQVHRRYSVSI